MNEAYMKQSEPVIIPTNDGKHIEEHFGVPSTGQQAMSIARMIAPPGWSEPPQTPEFDEYTLVVRGRKRIAVAGDTIELSAGESLWVHRGNTVQYSNPFEEPVEYWSVCTPAFSPDKVHRAE